MRNARIADGAGNPRYRGDVGISGDRIVAVGRVGDAEAARTIDCADRIISPGAFIDMHSHADVMLLAEPRHEAKIFQGVTTDVLGQGMACRMPRLPATLQQLRKHIAACNGNRRPAGIDHGRVVPRALRSKVSVNVVYLVPHAAVRAEVLGGRIDARPGRELERMQALVDEGMADGAAGFATGLDYTLNIWSDTDELVALCSVVARRGNVRHARGTIAATVCSIRSVRRSRSGSAAAFVQISHLRGDRLGRQLTQPGARPARPGPGPTGSTLPATAIRTPRQQPALAACSRLGPRWRPGRLLDRAARPPPAGAHPRRVGGLGHRLVAGHARRVRHGAEPKMEGWSPVQAAEELGKEVPDLLCDLLVEEDLAVSYISERPAPKNLSTRVLAHPLATSGSDGLCLGSACHPRTYGSFAHVLGHYVRERRIMPLEEAVRKMTSACASRLGMTDRGLVRAAWWPTSPSGTSARSARSTYARPLELGRGVSHVLVGGALVLDDGRHTATLRGRSPLLG